MELINSGATPPERLLEFLHGLHPQVGNLEDSDFGIDYICNHKGNWTVCFGEVPHMGNLLGVLTFFETEQHWDNLETLIFNYNEPNQQSFTGAAGTGRLSYYHLAAVVSVVAAETEARYERFRKERAKE